MKKLVIMRGLPGSGKSTYIKEYTNGWNAKVCSADDYFVDTDSVYRFNPTNIDKAHEQCKRLALKYMHDEVPLVFIDNTNTQHWEYQLYIDMAELFGYEVTIKTIGETTISACEEYDKRNVHGVPFEAIVRMAKRWED